MKNRKAFTIIELVIVIAIIAILAAVLIPVFGNIIKTARTSFDMQLVRNLNTTLAVNQATDGSNKTMKDALDDVFKSGYDVTKITPTNADNEILWDQTCDRFVLYYANGTYEALGKDVDKPIPSGNDIYKLWKIYTSTDDIAADAAAYSVYWNGGDLESITVSVGFDAGTANVASVTYKNETEIAKTDVVIRTNSASTTLTIDDASEGTIYHYGSAGALNIIQCHTASYHENGSVAFAEISKGRIVLENGSEIKHIHVNANEEANGFDTVIIADNGAKALPEAITRDQVDVSEAKPVVTVESGSASETVYVYPYTDSESTKTGTTEQTTTQNTAIATDLGKLVLDNGSDAGEKAMSNNEKTSAKGGLVEEAISEQIIDQGKKDGDNYVARYGTTGYMSVGDAINAAATSGKVYILKDADVNPSDFSKKVTLVGNGQTLTFVRSSENNTSDALNIFKVSGVLSIDLNGKEIQGKSYINSTYYEPLIVNNGKLTIKDSVGGGLLTTNYHNANAVALLNLGDFVLESGTLGGPVTGSNTFKCGTPIIVGSNSTTTINGGKIIGDSRAIGLSMAKQNIEPTATINNTAFDSTFNNKIIINGGILASRSAEVIDLSTRSKGANYCNETTNDIIINGGTFQHVNNDAGMTYNSDSTKAIIAVQKGHANITINDGTFNASNGNVIEVLYESFYDSKINIKGGNFTTSESKYVLKVTKNSTAADSPTDIVYNVDGGTFSQINNLLNAEEELKANISGTYSSYIQQ